MDLKKTAAGILALAVILAAPMPAIAAPAGSAMEPKAAIGDQGNVDKETAEFLDRFFADQWAGKEPHATVVAVVKNGKVLAEKGYGHADKGSGKPVDPKTTTFRVGSIAKVFTVIGLLQLVDQGKISLDDNIEKYLHGYRVDNPFDQPVTLEMLITHSTGFEVRDPTEGNYLFDPAQKPATLKEAIFANFPPVVREPGTSYMYDNFASGLAGYIVQEVSGQPFNEYITEHVFEPLDMKSSSFEHAAELAERLPQVYDASGEAIPEYRLSPEVLPEGSMITTAEDMAKFMTVLLNEGKTPKGKSLLSPSSMKAMMEYRLAILPDVPDMTYGFEAPGLLRDANGKHVIAKSGGILGFESLVFLLPGEETGVFISSADPSGLTTALFGKYMDRFFPGEAELGNPAFKPQALDELKKFEGIYEDLRIPGMFTRVKASGDGTLTAGDQAGRRAAFKQADELLFLNEQGHPAAFKKDAEGNIVYMKYSNPGSYAGKLPDGQGFADISATHPYAQYILGLQSMGVLKDHPGQPFGPERKVSRGAFVQGLMKQFGLPASSGQPPFTDIGNSPYTGDIQAAYELGMITGGTNGRFEPDRNITREEAAVITLRLLQISGYQVKESGTKLAEGTSAWAEQAVKTLIDLKMHGDEVTVQGDVYDYSSKRELTRQEFAAIQYLLMLPEKSLLQ